MIKELNKIPKAEVKVPFGDYSPLAVAIVWKKNEGWQEPTFVHSNTAQLPYTISMLQYGGGVFEGMKGSFDEDGYLRIFQQEEHFSRFNRSLARMALPSMPSDLFFRCFEALLTEKGSFDLKGGKELYIRPFLFNSTTSLGANEMEECRFVITTAPLAFGFKLAKCIVELEQAKAFVGGVAKAKTAGNYALAQEADMRAQALGYDTTLWTSAMSHSFVEEFSTMNMFCVRDGIILTPSITQGTILEGITRQAIFKVASSLGFQIREARIGVVDLIFGVRDKRVTEFFGTGTASLVKQFSTIGYKDDPYLLPEYDERSVSSQLRKELQDISVGRSHPEMTTPYKI